MKACAGFALGLSILALAPAAFSQTVQQMGGANPAFQPAPAYYPAPHRLENIGKTGQFIFGIERISGLFLDRQTLTYKDPVTRAEHDYTFKNTSFGLLGMDSNSPAALPRFALDYVVYQGFTVGGSLMLSTRAMSLSGSGEKPATPSTSNNDGLTLYGGARVGYAYPFDSTFAIWPRAGLSYVSSSGRAEVWDPATKKSLGTYEVKTNFGELDLEVLFAVSPIEHIVVTAGPYLDLGIAGGYSLLQGDTETDSRDARMTSYGVLINAAGYY